MSSIYKDQLIGNMSSLFFTGWGGEEVGDTVGKVTLPQQGAPK